MKCIIGCFACLLLLVGCTIPETKETYVVVLIVGKANVKDGLYLNLSDPDIITQTYSGEEIRYFAEFDQKDRKIIPYDRAYKAYKKRYRESYFELFPGDFLKVSPNETYDAIMIDTLKETAFTNKIGATSRMYKFINI